MQSPKARILFTEDDADTRELVTFFLNMEGFDVFTTQNQHEALTLAKQKQFDLYLLDSWMPGQSGVELCKKLREFDSKTPILFYTGAAFEADRQRALESGAQGYLVKPVDTDLLLAEISRLISTSSGPEMK